MDSECRPYTRAYKLQTTRLQPFRHVMIAVMNTVNSLLNRLHQLLNRFLVLPRFVSLFSLMHNCYNSFLMVYIIFFQRERKNKQTTLYLHIYILSRPSASFPEKAETLGSCQRMLRTKRFFNIKTAKKEGKRRRNTHSSK